MDQYFGRSRKTLEERLDTMDRYFVGKEQDMVAKRARRADKDAADCVIVPIKIFIMICAAIMVSRIVWRNWAYYFD